MATTDRAFALVAGRGLVGRAFRAALLPLVGRLVGGSARLRRLLFRVVSQTRVTYREGPLSAGRAGRVRAGDRLPWVPFAGGDNFAPLASLDWQVHVHGQATDCLLTAAAAAGLTVHEFPWGEAAEKAGLRRDATYLVRPDGHVAAASAAGDAGWLTEYLGRHGLTFRSAAAAPAGR